MASPSPKKVKIDLSNLENMPPRYRAHVKLLKMGKDNNELLKNKPEELFKLDPDFKEAYGTTCAAWRSLVHRIREECDVSIRGMFSTI